MEQIDRVIYTIMQWPWKMWGFGEAIAVRALQAADQVRPHMGAGSYATALLYTWLGRGIGGSHEDHVGPGRELLDLATRSDDERLLDAAIQLGRAMVAQPVDGDGARRHRPDLVGWSGQIWVDCMDSEPPFLVRLGRVLDDEALLNEGIAETLAYARLMQDTTSGLFRHGHDRWAGVNGQLWARGNGWALLGLVDVLRSTPTEHDDRSELLDRLAQLCRGLEKAQNPGGLWHTLVDDPSTYLESTLAAMGAIALRDAFDSGLLDESAFGRMEQNARRAAIELIDENGRLDRVSTATPVGPRQTYTTRPFGTYPWGQGPALLMLLQHNTTQQ